VYRVHAYPAMSKNWLFALFHGGNTGSNPVGDAKNFKTLRR
jgi:hypothetical protein